MRRLFLSFFVLLTMVSLSSCSMRFEKLLEDGKYQEAERMIKRTRTNAKYDFAETLIYEYIELEEYDKAVRVYEKLTPEHCSSYDLQWPSLYCHGKGENYEINVTDALRNAFMEIGDYDKVWKYSIWTSDDDNGRNAESYYKFMSEVILYLCSNGNKTEANKFLKHYVFWFDTRIDNDAYYLDKMPQFQCDLVRSKLQKVINTY